jgi:hypothetical protein
LWCHLDKPDTKFNAANPKYKITILLDKAEDSSGRLDFGKNEVDTPAFIEHIRDLCKKHGVKAGALKDGDKGDREDQAGKWVITASTSFKPEMVDTRSNPLKGESARIMQGDVVRVAMTPQAGTRPGSSESYLSMYIKSIMLVDKRSGAANLFGEEDGDGFVMPTDAVDHDVEVPELEDEDVDF